MYYFEVCKVPHPAFCRVCRMIRFLSLELAELYIRILHAKRPEFYHFYQWLALFLRWWQKHWGKIFVTNIEFFRTRSRFIKAKILTKWDLCQRSLMLVEVQIGLNPSSLHEINFLRGVTGVSAVHSVMAEPEIVLGSVTIVWHVKTKNWLKSKLVEHVIVHHFSGDLFDQPAQNAFIIFKKNRNL